MVIVVMDAALVSLGRPDVIDGDGDGSIVCVPAPGRGSLQLI
jgi:hypothetical protein